MTEVGGTGAGGDSQEVLVDRVVIIGVGLMGGSLGLALMERHAVHEVVGIDSADVLAAAVAAGAIHHGGACTAAELEQAVERADLVILATPIHTIVQLLQQIAPHVASHATVTDLASVKSSIASEGERLLGDRFIGGHPMAGSEQTGIESARSSLFIGASWALTPSNTTKATPRLQVLCNLVRAVGAAPMIMDPREHDRAAALISHLPHLICYAYNETVDSSPEAANALSLAAGSYRDLTRVAASDPVLWRDVFIENREFLLEMLCAYKSSLAALEDAVKNGNPDTILDAIMSAWR